LRRAYGGVDKGGNFMMPTVAQIHEVLPDFRRMLPAQTETARAIDHHAPLDEVAAMALRDGYIDNIEDFALFVEACVRRPEKPR
jgi:hypothetical protein